MRAAHVEQPLVPWNGPAGERRGPARALALLSAPDVLEALDAAVIVRSPEGEIEYWNRGAERLYGWTAEEAIGHAGIGFLVAEGEEQRFAELVAQVNQHGSAEGELRLRRKDGSTFAGHFRTAGVQDADGRLIAVVGVTLDVSRRVEAGEALVAGETRLREAERARGESESLFRKGFDDAPIGMAIERPSDGRYLRVNDALCRMVGRTRDALLELTSDEITHPDDLSLSSDARGEVTGGGCFRDLQKRYARPDGTLVWASVHGSGVEDASGAVTRLFSQIVDIGDQKAREAQLDAAVADAGWLSRIRDALDEDRLVLFAQPIVDLSSGETVQRELLIRMRERDGTFVSPGEFLPAAERYGLIGEIDTWVIGQAAALAAGGTPVEINLSGLSIGDPAILAAVERALEESGADPKLLVFEVTETAVASDLDAGRAFAEQLKALGCGFALDDFGTGFGGLTYLKHLPADTLKIDIDFVRDLLTSEPDQRLVRAIVDLAHGFGQTTIAEGVEDEQTLQRLREMGVDRAQGYFLGRPGPLRDGPDSWSPSSDDAERGAAPEDPIEQVRAFLDVFASRDVDLALKWLHPEVDVRVFATSERSGHRKPYRGHDGARAYFADAASVWEKLEIEPITFRHVDDTVIVFGRVHARTAAGEVHADALWVWKFRDGLIASVQTFRTPDG